MRFYSIKLYEANIFILRCFSPLILVFLLTTFPINDVKPITPAVTSNPKTTGVATTVDIKTAPVNPVPRLIVIYTLSTLFIILDTLKYFLQKFSLTKISFSKNFCYIL